MRPARILGVIAPCLFTFTAAAADERTCTMRDASFPAPSMTYVLCEQGLLLVTANEGATWNTLKIEGASGLRALAFLDTRRGIAVGEGGAIWVTGDAGKTWETRKSDTTEILAGIQTMGEQAWIVGYDGVILHSADAGRTWTPQKSTVTQALEVVNFLDAKNGWVVGWSGTILHTTDGGASWKHLKSTDATWSLSSICFRDAKTGFISGFAGQLLRTNDGGATWSQVKAPYTGWLTSVAFDNAGRGWITTDDGLLISTDGGDNWKLVANEGGAEAQFFLNKLLRTTGTMWALGPFGLMKQTGNGTTWKSIGNPLSESTATPGK